MKRRSFLSLLGLAPAAPLIAKEMAKAPEVSPVPSPVPTVRFEKCVDYACMVTVGHWVNSPSEWRKG
jgi:hypothetical protein